MSWSSTIESYRTTLDRVQGYQVVSARRRSYNPDTVLMINQQLAKLLDDYYSFNEACIFDDLLKINKMIDDAMEESSVTSADISRFIRSKQQPLDLNINEVVIDILDQEIKQLTCFVTALKTKSNIPVMEDITQQQHTVNGKLLKECVCVVCSNTFNANRKNAKYCSDKCKQAAYRNRKVKE
jgi:hypothetical protein